MTVASAPQKLSLLSALKEFGWLPLLLLGIGGLSIIDILETAVVGELSLITPFRLVMDGYQRVSALIGAIVEPPLAPLTAWLGGLLHLDLELQPYWRSLFLVQAIAVSSIVRSAWAAGQFLDAFIAAAVMYTGCLLLALVVGLAPPIASAWFQALIAAALVVTLWLTFGVGAAIGPSDPGATLEVKGAVIITLVTAVLTAILAALLVLFSPIGAGAAIAAYGLFVAAFGLLFIGISFGDGDTDSFRIGLGIFGGFVAAALILIANAAIEAFG